MQNVLNFPTKKTTKEKSPFVPLVEVFERICQSFKKFEEHKEHEYKIKVEFLKDECYKVYLRRILEKRRLLKIVDFPEFFYANGWAIDSEAMKLSEQAVRTVEEKYGRKHIEKCYNARIKDVIKNLKRKR